MTHEEFFDALKRGEIAPAYFFHGEEEHVKASALEALRARLLPAGLEALNETALQNPAAAVVVAAAETLPLMAERRLVVVRDSALLTAGKASDEAAESAALVDYLGRLPDTACVVFFCRGVADGRKTLTQALLKQAAVVRFDPLGDAALARWIASRLRRTGKRISAANAEFLVFTCGRELLTLGQELDKLSAHAGEREEISRADIETVATPTRECTVFQMVDALVEGREPEAFRLLAAMLERRQERIGILAMIARQYRHMLHASLMKGAGLSDAQVQKALGVPAFAYRRLLQQMRGMDDDALRARLNLCVETDFAIKSGRMREDAALERVMLRLGGGNV